MSNVSYGMHAETNFTYEEAIENVTAALKEQGFGILTEIDVKATLKKKIDVDTDKYIILGACNPKLAHRALSNEQQIGLLLPCNVIVYEDADSGKTHISIMDPQLMVKMTDNDELCAVADEASAMLKKVIEAVRA